MSESIHGHEVMQMMIASGKNYTADELEKEIQDRFGLDARFHTCSCKDMSARELIAFLESKGKFIQTEDGFRTHPDRVCSH